MKTKNSKRVFKTTNVSDEVFAFISASASLLTELQNESVEAAYLAHNLWCLYHQLGSHERFYKVKSFENKLTKTFFS